MSKGPRLIVDEESQEKTMDEAVGVPARGPEPVEVGAFGNALRKMLNEGREIRPFFSSAWVAPEPPEGSELVEEYELNGTRVKLCRLEKETESLYHVTPFEYTLPVEVLKLIFLARNELSEHQPTGLQLGRQEQARAYVSQVAEELIIKHAQRNRVVLGKDRLEEIGTAKRLAGIVAKYTTGFGISEVFLEDGRIQDVYIDSPPTLNPIYLTIGGADGERLRNKCRTNVRLSKEDYEALLSRFRFESGRPFSEAMPVLEHNLAFYDARVTTIGKPLSPNGIAVAIRRHSLEPWTLPKLVAKGMLSPMAAGLISFLIDGKSTILVAGSRGSGKTSLLGAMMLELPQSQRILTIEDTQELPTSAMQKLGYKVQSMVVQSSLGGRGEMTAEDALKVSLRLGESAIVLGEVRGQEARTLYEAMRAGTAGSSVMGTFHADSAKSVFERVTHDMGISPKSFHATDVVIIAGLTKPGGTQREVRKVKQIAEVVKLSGKDGDFNDLMVYDTRKDELLATDILGIGSEKIASIARSWGMTFDDAVRNIKVRAEIRRTLVELAQKHSRPELLSPRWVALSNNAFWNLIEKNYRDGRIDHGAVLRDWMEWLRKNAGIG